MNADTDAVTTEEWIDDGIVADVTGLADASDDEDAMGARSRAFTVRTLSQALDAVDVQRRFACVVRIVDFFSRSASGQ